MTLWDEVKQNAVEAYTTAAERTDQLARLGMRAYDKFSISRDIERQFAELGSRVHELLEAGEGTSIPEDEQVAACQRRIGELELELYATKQEMEDLRHARAAEASAGSTTERPHEAESGTDDSAPAAAGASTAGPEESHPTRDDGPSSD